MNNEQATLICVGTFFGAMLGSLLMRGYLHVVHQRNRPVRMTYEELLELRRRQDNL